MIISVHNSPQVLKMRKPYSYDTTFYHYFQVVMWFRLFITYHYSGIYN